MGKRSSKKLYSTGSKRYPVARQLCLYTAEELDPILTRMVREAALLLPDHKKTIIVGVLRRGSPLAAMIADRLKRDFNFPELRRFDLRVQRYADDLSLLYPETLLEESNHYGIDLKGQTILLVDDVLFQGHSLIRVLHYLQYKGVQAVRTAVLVDRCTTLLPIHADIVGIRLQIAASDIIECHVPPYEPSFKIELVRRSLSE